MISASIGCNSEQKFEGNYSTCYNGLYAELYIDDDSMQSATSMGWISNKVQFKIKNDTLYNISFGELTDSVKARIKYLNKDKIELYYPTDSITYTLTKISDNIDWIVDYEKFWNEFYDRREKLNCYPISGKSK